MLISAFTRVFNALCNDGPTIYGNRTRGLMRSRPEGDRSQIFLWKARNPARGCALVQAERAL